MAAPMLLAGELAAYSDAALDRYLEENGRFARFPLLGDAPCM